ncbi:hypothetical protein HYPSUDRAFT_202156 [Hypholoma sublateritium FD-334 SS-4]|uniref:Ubiquitin-like protease family profile domain-containing protein n=1 Tax=Hypholoma sublateritium (strain FD-334 SS-4) TaxID=945553 RepID=A0A0D2P0V2_HYPSF|nr:hypothetical protein HYPSUDRAFT_202156 [Hypholoma sublateritium FD-334 SS-4]
MDVKQASQYWNLVRQFCLIEVTERVEASSDNEVSTSVAPDLSCKETAIKNVKNPPGSQSKLLSEVPSEPQLEQSTVTPDDLKINILEDVLIHSVVPSVPHWKEVLSRNAYFLEKWDSQGPSTLLTATPPVSAPPHEEDDNNAGFGTTSLAGEPEIQENAFRNSTPDNHQVRETSFQRRGITDHSSSPATLNAGKWLNDEIINSYIDLLDETLESGVVVLTTFAYAKFSGQTAMHSHEVISLLRKKRTCSTIQQALATYRLIIMPINWQNLHWLAVVLNVDNATVTFMDSLPERDGQKPGNRRVKEIMQVLKRCLNLGVEWRPVEADVPTQGNGYDCGVFCAQFIKFVYLKLPIPIWSQLEMVELRDTMTIELFEQSLRTPRFVDKIKLNQ